jgi:hypothetical protein
MVSLRAIDGEYSTTIFEVIGFKLQGMLIYIYIFIYTNFSLGIGFIQCIKSLHQRPYEDSYMTFNAIKVHISYLGQTLSG